ncbi:MAG: DUF4105 domain-containing protein [Pseudomonas sp.]|uniref:Lnb N-terminal periplasmic domain-containing protein n=1 Tax=Pseudomonas sp. TaxID=306 RepID=UPI00299E0C95|nr:DUF4105 domain-containing protein [Pseudomonas sp.]MDX1723820.1 DUF4105 domain-containing protein [Pseudomonas sp.]
MRKLMRRYAFALALLLLGLLIVIAGGWGVLAITFTGPADTTLRNSLAGAVAIASLTALVGLGLRRWRGRSLVAYLILFAGLLAWWWRVEPSNQRDWQTDVAVLPYATIDGDRVTVHNIRNFDYRSETDYTPAWYDKTFDLNKLEGVDLIASYWMGPAIAHTFLSFAFEGGDHLAVSIETRKEKGEAYSTIKGFFRQYELFYVVADERDVIRLRTNFRQDPPEQVYLYRLKGSLENGRRLFLEYLRGMNALRDKPEFYNTLTTNCTTQIWLSARVNTEHIPFSWKILASGYVPQYLYENGRLGEPGLSFDEVQRRALINTRANAVDSPLDFSARIRDLSLLDN